MPDDSVGPPGVEEWPPVAEEWPPVAEEWSPNAEEWSASVEEDPPSAENEPPRAQRCHKEKCRLWMFAPGLLLTLLSTSYILYASNVDLSSSIDFEEWLKERVKSCPSEAPYAIDTPGCQLANFCPNSRDIAEFTNSSQFKEPWCEFKFSSEQPPLFEANATGLYLQPGVLERYDITDPLNAVNCCYWSMVPTIEPYERDFTEENYPIKCRSELCQNPPSLSSFCFPLQPWVAVPSNIHMLHLSCYRTDTPVVPIELYHDYFAFIRRDDAKLRARCEASGTCDKREQLFNVMVVGVDAGSRLNFKRNLLETHEVLTKLLGAVELRGYNSVAKSSLASFASVAAGTELHETCWLQDAKSCPKSLWETFAERGFATALVEDPPLENPSIGFGTLRRSAVDNFGSPLIDRRTGLPTSDPNIRDMARRMVQVMNNVYLSTLEDCFWLQLNEVLYAEQVPNSVLNDTNSKTYFLNFNTWPDQMVFEGRFVLRPAIDKNPWIYSVNITNVLTTKFVLQDDCVQALLDKKNVQQLILFERNWKRHGGK